MSQKIMPPTDDTTLDDEYQIIRLDALPDNLQELAARHVQDQFDAVPSYVGRFVEED
jgi:hypothetical protein